MVPAVVTKERVKIALVALSKNLVKRMID